MALLSLLLGLAAIVRISTNRRPSDEDDEAGLTRSRHAPQRPNDADSADPL